MLPAKLQLSERKLKADTRDFIISKSVAGFTLCTMMIFYIIFLSDIEILKNRDALLQMILFVQTVSIGIRIIKANFLVKTELIFGLSIPDGGMISESEWEQFKNLYIAPKFKNGFTIINADGQWTDQTGESISEKSKILILIHKNDKKTNSSIETVRSVYKQNFNQESILRVSYFTEFSNF